MITFINYQYYHKLKMNPRPFLFSLVKIDIIRIDLGMCPNFPNAEHLLLAFLIPIKVTLESILSLVKNERPLRFLYLLVKIDIVKIAVKIKTC